MCPSRLSLFSFFFSLQVRLSSVQVVSSLLRRDLLREETHQRGHVSMMDRVPLLSSNGSAGFPYQPSLASRRDESRKDRPDHTIGRPTSCFQVGSQVRRRSQTLTGPWTCTPPREHRKGPCPWPGWSQAAVSTTPYRPPIHETEQPYVQTPCAGQRLQAPTR